MGFFSFVLYISYIWIDGILQIHLTLVEKYSVLEWPHIKVSQLAMVDVSLIYEILSHKASWHLIFKTEI